ncbi:MAG: SRPBCC domain-containing protein [Planctomycetota bacterium]|nr:MAG: SRPBCC domain-containing protein [Planctomycetota bacterium]REJ91999.1 MAG: SRPBCC domain-containing protein [Planctomycetota bacterium]REK28535.1 MAG: SRPBCC domain-containing protein [Planctomycetota bacterium]REK39150.1 MAG: SRPBCC domain-containing protein [Planctomycetota bacterium]
MIDKSDEVVVRRLVKASREIAFEAWTTPEHVEKWWSPTDTAQCTLCEIDLRVGGQYRLNMSDPADGATCEVEGEFREVTQPERLVYTWNARTDQGDVDNTLVTVEFHALGDDATEVLVRHSDLPDTPIREGHREGWQKMLASFANHLAISVRHASEDFRMALEYDVPAARLFEQFSSREGVGHWWTKDCDYEPHVGGKASFRFGDSGFYANMEVMQLDAPKLVEWKVLDAKHPDETGFSDLYDWNGTTIRFEMTPLENNRSRLDFTHVGLGPLECETVCASLWAYYLNESLREYFEHGQGKAND